MRILFLIISIFAIVISIYSSDGRLSEVEDIERPDSIWEAEFQNRIMDMWGERIPNYKIHPDDPTEDCGKRYWSRLLSQLQYADKYGLPFDSLIKVGGRLLESQHAGSFRKPFSCAGFAMYFFNWKDSIAKYDPSQLDRARMRVDSMWRYLLRADHLLDACCGYNERGGKEFNSENFQWMLKATGYLFAHEMHQKNIKGQIRDMHNINVDSIEIRPLNSASLLSKVNYKNVDVLDYFDNSLINLTKTLYSSGRVEWNSNNYFGHTMNPLHTIFQSAKHCNDPEWEENQKRAQACLDWMLTEAALHYRDGFQVAADSRAKNGSFLPFKGSYFQYTVPYFSDCDNYPSFGRNIWSEYNPGDAEIGFIATSAYRPPQVLIDIARKDFDLPVEIQSAKPFYHIDMGEFLSPDGTIKGESAYSNYNKEEYGKRFEFETLYIGNNFTMSSVAAGRPDGREGTFSEQCLWRIGFEGKDNGCVMLSGNAGTMQTSTGRYPWHQIGQYRNMMMQLVESPETNRIWIAVPKYIIENENAFERFGNDLYLNPGSGAYMLIKPSSGAEISFNNDYEEADGYIQVEFIWPKSKTGALIMEVVEYEKEFSFEEFIELYKKQKVKLKNDRFSYTNKNGNTLEMAFGGTSPYLMTDRTFDTPYDNPLKFGGYYPLVWQDGKTVDFMTWDSYKTIYGFPVVNQKWHSGELFLRSRNNNAKIKVDSISGTVDYFKEE